MKVVELFAGVGGFRLGLEAIPSRPYEIVWSNQWEPSTKTQHASDVYVSRFGKAGHSNSDIAEVISENFDDIPEHDLLVGGFPCQDYSVARTLNEASGIAGKKGVLWWSIHEILRKLGREAPSYLMLENVDRLLKSPAKQRGRDFAVMLASLSDLGYLVEWRVINAADYGMPQRRRRVYIIAYKKGSSIASRIMATNRKDWLLSEGLVQHAFPTVSEPTEISRLELKGSLSELSEDLLNFSSAKSPFLTGGLMVNRKVVSMKLEPLYLGKRAVLKDILIPEKHVPYEYFISENELERWKYMKGAKKETRVTKDGFEYLYSEGGMTFPDSLDKPSRTIITGEGGRSPSRFKHVIETESGKFRRLTPLELERLNMFPDNHTLGASDSKRAFFMGNALVVGVVTKLGEELDKLHNLESGSQEESNSVALQL